MVFCPANNGVWCTEPSVSTQNVWVPVIAGFLAFTIAVGTFCRWRGMRRRRQLDVLERLEREADDIEERFVEYRENPTMFDASLGQSRSCSGRWSSVMPISASYNKYPELVTKSTTSTHWMLSRLVSEQVAELQRQIQRLRKRMNGHREEDAPAED